MRGNSTVLDKLCLDIKQDENDVMGNGLVGSGRDKKYLCRFNVWVSPAAKPKR
jgi:hypothetical protein